MRKLNSQEPMSLQQRYKIYDERAKDILVDFDGTICTWAYPNFGEPTPGVHETFRALRERGFRIIIWTSRVCPTVHTPEERATMMDKIAAYMRQHAIPYDGIDSYGKRSALAYVDDRAVSFTGGFFGWEGVMRGIQRIEEDVEKDQKRERQERVSLLPGC